MIWQYHGCSPVLQRHQRNKLQATECYINHVSSWYFLRKKHCRTGLMSNHDIATDFQPCSPMCLFPYTASKFRISLMNTSLYFSSRLNTLTAVEMLPPLDVTWYTLAQRPMPRSLQTVHVWPSPVTWSPSFKSRNSSCMASLQALGGGRLPSKQGVFRKIRERVGSSVCCGWYLYFVVIVRSRVVIRS